MTNPTARALRIAERQREAITFAMDALRRDEVTRFDRMVELREQLKGIDTLIRMLGGEPAEYSPGRLG